MILVTYTLPGAVCATMYIDKTRKKKFEILPLGMELRLATPSLTH